MNSAYIISRINEFEYRLSDKIKKWLLKRFPAIDDNWWENLVVNNLSNLQREQVTLKKVTDLNGLDLASLLRVIDRNWFIITSSYYVNNRERQKIKDMMEIRNSWAHITDNQLSKEKVKNDVDVIIDLMQAFDASMTETRDMEAFLLDVEADRDILQTKTVPVKDVSAFVDVDKQKDTIEIGSLVTLTSDSSKVGAVISVSGEKYTVLIDSQVQTFYREQIQPQQKEKGGRRIPLKRLKNALTAYQIINPGSSNLYSLNSARIDFVPYQFRPALKMIKSDSPRLLVADDVGVGKTIEAGLILKEMEARSAVESVLVICPRPLVTERKWELEMKRFDESFTQMDGKALQTAIFESDMDGEWPERHKKTIIPYSLFNEDMIMGTESTSEKRKKSLGLSQLNPLPHFDLVIVDEAHTIRNSNTWAYKGVELFCRNADAVVFMTATPLQNSNSDLYTLLNLLRPDIVLDKDTFETMSEPNPYVNALMRTVRNQESDWQEVSMTQIKGMLSTQWGRSVLQHNPYLERTIELIQKGTITREEKIEAISAIEKLHTFNSIITRTRRKDIEDFCIRRTITVENEFSPIQRELYDALMRFEEKTLSLLHGNSNVIFMMCTVMRQAASSIYGLIPLLNTMMSRRLGKFDTDIDTFDTEMLLDEDCESTIFELLTQIKKLAEQLPEKDEKIEKLQEVIELKQEDENNRVIVFSSFRHTLDYVYQRLVKKGYRVAKVDGSVPDEERFSVRKKFLLPREAPEAIDVLLFSEVGCEGLDYQFCDTMINYDLPWNPMRIEQRIGRIDRRGQKSDTVKIYNMITKDTIDAVIYERCLIKIGIFESSIGDCSEILGDISNQIFKIMFDSALSDAEKKIKIEKMADNEVLRVQEMQRLEQDEKELFGFDLTNYMQNKDVQDAENQWISPQSINNLVELYLDDLLKPGEYILGKGSLRNLRLSSEKRRLLLEEFGKLNLTGGNMASKQWKAYLKSDLPLKQLTFESTCANDNRNAMFITQTHPLAQCAARYEGNLSECEVAISVSDNSAPEGNYEFLIYAWKYVGLKPDIQLVPVCKIKNLQNSILSFLQFGTEIDMDLSGYESKWNAMDTLHYEKWQDARNNYSEEVRADCSFRLDHLRLNTDQQIKVIKRQINKTEENRRNASESEKKNYDLTIRMRTSQINKLETVFAEKEKLLTDTISKADIHTELLVKGVLQIKHDNQ